MQEDKLQTALLKRHFLKRYIVFMKEQTILSFASIHSVLRPLLWVAIMSHVCFSFLQLSLSDRIVLLYLEQNIYQYNMCE